MKAYIIFISFLIFSAKDLQCGDEYIKNCSECDKNENLNSCKICDDNYFPFLENSICIPCDDNLYGQPGCSGKCSGTDLDISHKGKFKCDGECKEGYYKLDNICEPCSSKDSNCGKCIIDPDLGDVICKECINNQYILIDGRCLGCRLASNCEQCHYEGNETICDKCIAGYYLKGNICENCYWHIVSDGKVCEICSDDVNNYNPESCYCMIHYTKGDSENCIKCPDNCYRCGYNNKNIKCYICDNGYTLNSQGICISCGDNCDYCTLDINENPICISCNSNHILNDNNNCLDCGDNCISCIKGKDNTIECTKCIANYGLNSNKICTQCPEKCNNCIWNDEIGDFGCTDCSSKFDIIGKDEKCVSCDDIEEIGGSLCAECYYDKSPGNNKYKCTRCSGIYENAFIENEYKCVNYQNDLEENFDGCLNITYNENENKYECLQCQLFYIYIINEKKCLLAYENYQNTDLNYLCLEANNIGTAENPIYTCVNCLHESLVKIKDTNNQQYCGMPEDKLINCLEATKDEYEKIECTKCNYNLDLINDEESNQMVCPEVCDDDSFYLYKSCYKCDDKLFGNPGCLPESRCTFDYDNNHLNCNQCKEGYFLLSSGGCSPCSSKNIGCKKCADSNEYNFICDDCLDEYTLNSSNLCEPIKIDQYLEIIPGCLINEDNINEYQKESKCQYCKEGFFKTKEETCIYCKSSNYGGHGCEQCAYDDDNQIKCIYCPKGNVLDSNGKCLKCKEELGEGCSNCKYILDEEYESNKLICTECINDYYLNSKGQCIYPKNYAQYIPNCRSVKTEIKPISDFDFDNDFGFDFNFNFDFEETNLNPYTFDEIKSDNYEIISSCESCKEGFYYKEGQCIEINMDDCTLSSISFDITKNNMCYYDFCLNKKYAIIYYLIDIPEEIPDLANEINIIYEYDYYGLFDIIDDIIWNINTYTKDDIFKSLNMNSYMCIGNLGTGDENNPVELKDCISAIYNKTIWNYECIECKSGYILDQKTNRCIQEIKFINEYSGLNCEFENIGTTSQPLYSCIRCNNQNDIIVTTESGVKFCTSDEELKGCTEANVDTTYIKNKYDCTKCSLDYILYNSKFYGRNICQNINSKIIRSYDLNLNEYSTKEKESVQAINGECVNKKLFTPDKINCYACNSKNVGMPGCKGTCTFSMYRENYLECEENGCKSGYIEISKGICKTCNEANKGCMECHYDNNYPNDYKGLKRKRRFVCDLCEEGYILLANGTCHTCYELGLSNCENCEWNKNRDNELTCSQCSQGYFTGEDGECTRCINDDVRVNEYKCTYCTDRENGGMEGCISCESDNNTIIGCKKCDKGYILNENNKKCVKITDNDELENYPNCLKLVSKNNKFECSLCEESYAIYSESTGDKCISSDLIFTHDINLNKYCEKFINKGTKERPIYSCDKCIDNLNYPYNDLIKFTFESNGTSFCDIYNYNYNGISFCKEAIIIEKENGIEYNCTECKEGYNKYLYNEQSNIFNCQNDPLSFFGCVIKNCKQCKKNSIDFCETCYQPDIYKLNTVSGFCVKKTEKIPYIIWKDIYAFEMKYLMIIHSERLNVPFLKLRGLTSSQINEEHSFSFYLYFKSKNLLRNLETELINKKLSMICRITEGVDESVDEINIVDYECYGNITKEEIEELENLDIKNFRVEEDNINNKNNLMPSNLNELNLYDTKLENKMSQFSLDNFLQTSIFELDNIENQTSYNYHFNFRLSGKIKGYFNSDLNRDLNINFNEIEKIEKCNIEIGKDKRGYLNCDINLDEYSNPNLNIFSLKVENIEIDNNIIDLSQLNNIYLEKLEDKNEEKGKIEDFIPEIEHKSDQDGNDYEDNGIKKNKKDNTKLYIICGSGGAVVLGTIITIILCVKSKNSQPITQNLFANQFNPYANKYVPTNNFNPSKINMNKSKAKKKKRLKIINKIKKPNVNNSSKRNMISFNKK